MKNKFLLAIKSITLVGAMLTVYPLMMLFSILILYSNAQSVTYANISKSFVFIMLCSVVFTFVGYGVSALIDYLKNKKGISSIVNALYAVIFAVFATIILFVFPKYSNIIAAICCLISFIIGAVNFYKAYGNYISVKTFLYNTFFNLLVIILSMIFKLDIPMGSITLQMSIVFAFQIIIFIFSQGQANIDYMLERRNHSFEQMPKKIRYYNFYISGILSLIVIVVLAFYNQLSALLSNAIAKVNSGLFVLLRFILNPENTALTPGTMFDDLGEGMSAGQMMPKNENVIFTIIINCIGIFLIIAFTLGCIDPVKRAVKDMFLKLKEIIKDIFKIKPKKNNNRYNKNILEYSDDVQNLSAERIYEKKQQEFKLTRWKKSVKKFKAMEDTPQKYRIGYKLFLEYLAYRKVEINSNDTPNEILVKAKNKFPQDFNQENDITNIYNLIRYNELENINYKQVEPLSDFLEK